jgi:hypothetical protein
MKWAPTNAKRILPNIGTTRRSSLQNLLAKILVIDVVNAGAGALAALLPGFAVFEFHADSKLALLRWIGRQRRRADISPASQNRFESTQKFVVPPKEIDVFGRNNAGEFRDCHLHGSFAHIVSHLQRLNEKLRLNDSPDASLEIKCIVTAAPFGANSM